MAAMTLGIGPHSSFVIHWIISFLTDRTQATKLGLLDLSLSTLLSIKRPIVQGSGIGPTFLWSPYVIGQTIIFSSCFFLLSSSFFLFFSSPNLSGRRLDVYHTLGHGVALVRI